MKIFIDTNILKFSAVKHHILVPREKVIDWGEKVTTVNVHQMYTKNSLVNLRNSSQKRDAVALPLLAKAGMIGHLTFCYSVEVMIESARLPRIASASGRFFGCPIERVDIPLQVDRVWLGGGRSANEWTDSFINSIGHPRFVELCKVTGAYQGENKLLNRNQALDALHIWAAEEAQADIFLTMDYKLLRMVRNDTKQRVAIKLASPSEAIGDLLVSLGFIGSAKFLFDSLGFAKRSVGFDEGEGWK